MNKFFTIISLLFIVTYADCKKISFSDILTSFSQISQVEGAGDLVEATHREFEASVQKLEEYDGIVNNACSNLVTRSEGNKARLEGDIAKTQLTIDLMNARNAEIEQELVESASHQEEYAASKVQLENDLKEAAQDLENKALAIVERARVLRRLSDVLDDNLVGSQRSGTVSNFNVDKSLSGYSFVEVHNQLKELKSNDAMVKSMISTLILITQDEGLFANQETVGKIKNLLNSILVRDQENGEALRQAFAERTVSINESISSLVDNMNKETESDAERRAVLAENAVLTKFAESELADMRNHLNRNDARSQSNQQVCEKLRQGSNNARRRNEDGNTKFDELRSLIA